MKQSLIYFLGFVITLIMSACAMNNEVHFNKNYSGTYALYVDFADMVDMVKSFDPSMADMGEESFVDEIMSAEEREEMKQKINQIEGIGNASFEVIEESKMEFKFDFDDVESLNGAFSEIQAAVKEDNEVVSDNMAGMDGLSLQTYTRSGKVISHSASFPVDQLPAETMDGLDQMGGEGMMEMMMGMMDYTIVLSFDRKIKSVDIGGLDLISQDKHMVKTRIDFGKMMQGGSYHINVKTK